MRRHKRYRHTAFKRAILISGIALLGLLGAILVFMSFSVHPSPATPSSSLTTDLNGATVIPDDPISSPNQEKMSAEASSNTNISFPQQGVSFSLGEMNVIDGVITPPGFREVYRLRNLGVAPSGAQTGTVFLATHALSGKGLAPGNYLYSKNTQRPLIHAGDQIHIGSLHYVITGYQVVNKNDLGNHPEIWDNTPGGLKLITCLEKPGQKSATDNFIVSAQLQ